MPALKRLRFSSDWKPMRIIHAKMNGVMFITSSMFQMLVRYGMLVP